MTNNIDDYGYRLRWSLCDVNYREGYVSTMVDFHTHEYYEISLILSGSVKILLPGQMEEGSGSRVVLTAPGTPHFISCGSDCLYRRLNLLFSHNFVAEYVPEWPRLASLFGENGAVITLYPEQSEQCAALIRRVQDERDPFRQRLIILYLLSLLDELAPKNASRAEKIPAYVTGALSYINEHYAEKIIAAELAWQLGVGRTTLMTAFKAYTGDTLHGYLTQYRLKKAIALLRAGATEQEAAEQCGFGDSFGLIRSFKRVFGTPPRRYLAEMEP